MPTEILGCRQLAHDFDLEVGCCPSCHDDIDAGETDSILTVEHDGRVYEVCCDVRRAWEGRDNGGGDTP